MVSKIMMSLQSMAVGCLCLTIWPHRSLFCLARRLQCKKESHQTQKKIGPDRCWCEYTLSLTFSKGGWASSVRWCSQFSRKSRYRRKIKHRWQTMFLISVSNCSLEKCTISIFWQMCNGEGQVHFFPLARREKV